MGRTSNRDRNLAGRFEPGGGINTGDCSVEGCQKRAVTRTWCPAHYRRWRMNGDVQADVPLLDISYVDPSRPVYEPGGTQVIMATRGDDLVPVLCDANFVCPRSLSITSSGYAQMNLNQRVTVLHRYLLGLIKGDGHVGDHINGDRLDNRLENLRVVDMAGNAQNTSGRGQSRYLGVHRNESGWIASGAVNGVRFHLGSFRTEEEAAQVAHAWRVENQPFYVPRHDIPGVDL